MKQSRDEQSAITSNTEVTSNSKFKHYFLKFFKNEHTYSYLTRFLFISAFATTDLPFLVALIAGTTTGNYVDMTFSSLARQWYQFYQEIQKLQEITPEKKNQLKKDLVSLLAKTLLLFGVGGMFFIGYYNQDSSAGYMIKKLNEKFESGIGVNILDNTLAAIAAGSFTYVAFYELLGKASLMIKDHILLKFYHQDNNIAQITNTEENNVYPFKIEIEQKRHTDSPDPSSSDTSSYKNDDESSTDEVLKESRYNNKYLGVSNTKNSGETNQRLFKQASKSNINTSQTTQQTVPQGSSSIECK